MKKIIWIALILSGKSVLAQSPYWQQKLYFNIQASLDDKEHSISAKQTLVYKNNSDEALPFIWFHIWPNAYSNNNTALFKQISNDESRKKKLKGKTAGSITGLAFESKGIALKTSPHPNADYVDIIKVLLTSPLQPGDSIEISTPFTVKLPEYFSRSGYADGQFMACQWYPKPAVFDKNGWHEMPYLDMGEFYSEYAM
ncbi:MAG: hypothetical protein EOO06_20695 [Chitinophagaceae bacterium]|nr:MAG: hypothetical protein EOO06_20695 [Chitinophagaceae bacterium]